MFVVCYIGDIIQYKPGTVAKLGIVQDKMKNTKIREKFQNDIDPSENVRFGVLDPSSTRWSFRVSQIRKQLNCHGTLLDLCNKSEWVKYMSAELMDTIKDYKHWDWLRTISPFLELVLDGIRKCEANVGCSIVLYVYILFYKYVTSKIKQIITRINTNINDIDDIRAVQLKLDEETGYLYEFYVKSKQFILDRFKLSHGDCQILAHYLDIRYLNETVRLPGYGLSTFHTVCFSKIDNN